MGEFRSPLEQAAQAVAAMGAGGSVGKTVLVP